MTIACACRRGVLSKLVGMCSFYQKVIAVAGCCQKLDFCLRFSGGGRLQKTTITHTSGEGLFFSAFGRWVSLRAGGCCLQFSGGGITDKNTFCRNRRSRGVTKGGLFFIAKIFLTRKFEKKKKTYLMFLLLPV